MTRLASYAHDGRDQVGPLGADGRLHDLHARQAAVPAPGEAPLPPTMLEIIEAGDIALATIQRLARLGTSTDPGFAVDEVHYHPPVRRLSKIVCMAVNNSGLRALAVRYPAHPTFFLKAPSALDATRAPTPQGEPMRLFVLGATGATGQLFVTQALAAGHDVTAYVRNPGKITDRRVSAVAGTLDDVDALTSGMVDHDAVVSMLGNGSGKTDKTLINDSTRALVLAARASGVKRLIVMSAFGVGESLPKASWLGKLVYQRVLGEVFADKARGEAQLRETDLDWTVVYPVTLTDKAAAGQVVATDLAQTPKLPGLPKITRADVAGYLLTTATDGTFVRRTVVLRTSR